MKSPRPLRITGADRVMVLAVHPDDESLATGGLLQRAVAAGAAVRVIFVTDGENNPWPQRALERRWRIGPQERARWAQRRGREAVAALTRLGVPPANSRFLSWPDQGLTGLLLGGGARAAVAELAHHVQQWRPTLLFAPSLQDHHPDHNALAVFVRLALGEMEKDDDAAGPAVYHYLVHGQQPPETIPRTTLPLFVWEKRTKAAAIAMHASQLLLSRRRFLAYATDEEHFTTAPPTHQFQSTPDFRGEITAGGRLTSTWQLAPGLRPFERLTLFLVCASPDGEDNGVVAWTLPLQRTIGSGTTLQTRDGSPLGEATVRVEARQVHVHLPASLRLANHRVFIKLQRRGIFLDAIGWQELSFSPVQPQPERPENSDLVAGSGTRNRLSVSW